MPERRPKAGVGSGATRLGPGLEKRPPGKPAVARWPPLAIWFQKVEPGKSERNRLRLPELPGLGIRHPVRRAGAIW